ncbi:hypothetical protein H2200_009686 [Cladophialophora chaetospira]|uniref:Uncharacterized protein n=1 Tax=Cladophialophora chaetospira TaxID=386627 RepID=A0AA38X384_9EURO|nr:hypothetical protein H2200_009686 [Cladophialophora chaetospira]
MSLIKPESNRRPPKSPKSQKVRRRPGVGVNGSNTIIQLWELQRLEIARNDEPSKDKGDSLSRIPDSVPQIVSNSPADSDPSSQTVSGSLPRNVKMLPDSTQSFDIVTVVAKEIEDDIDWKLLDKHERLKSRGRSGKLKNLYDQRTDVDPEGQFVEVVDIPRGQVCCMINDINNGIHTNVVATKYGVSALVLVQTMARFAQLKILEATPPGETPELFD